MQPNRIDATSPFFSVYVQTPMVSKSDEPGRKVHCAHDAVFATFRPSAYVVMDSLFPNIAPTGFGIPSVIITELDGAAILVVNVKLSALAVHVANPNASDAIPTLKT